MLSIHEMKLHEGLVMQIPGLKNPALILRVPGGWLYRLNDVKTDGKFETVFVPYSSEFDDMRIPTPEELQAALEDEKLNQQAALETRTQGSPSKSEPAGNIIREI